MATSTLGSGTLVLAGTTSGTTTVTATAVAGTTTLTLPAATDTLVGKATTDTLTNKTLTGAVMNGTLGATTPSTVAATSISASTTLGVTGVSTLTGGAVIEGLTVGKGAGAVATNTAVGASALTANTSGFENSAGGRQALYSNTTGNYNTAFGHQAGYAIATTNQSTCVGSYAGLSTTGGFNSFFGYGAGNAITTGDRNTIIGSFDGNGDGLDIRTVSNYVVLADGSGNRQITMKEGQTLALDSAVPNAGTGITFPATQSASSNANTLDDYEEGTWTPSIGGTATYTAQQGSYVKIGKFVYIQCRLVINTIGTGSVRTITGFPFSASNSDLDSGIVISYYLSLATAVVSMNMGISGTSAAIRGATAATNTVDNPNIFGNSTTMQFGGTYITT